MDIIQAIILGIVQGITEWLPISSSGHLVIFQKLMDLHLPVYYDIILHLGSLLVVLLAFKNKILKLIKGVINKDRQSIYFVYKLLVASIPIAVVGLALNNTVKSAFESSKAVGVGLLFTALLLFSTYFPGKIKKFSAVKASIIGIAQAIAIFPGVSRSGATIGAGLLLGVKRDEAAFFSFMLFIPAIIGATLLELPGMTAVENWPAVIIGFIATIISGYISLILLIKLIKQQKFWQFGFYCLAIGTILLFN